MTDTAASPVLQDKPVLLAKELELFGPGIVCLTGGGGKTTLMYALGKALAAHEARVLCTTTTRIMRPSREESPYFVECENPSHIHLDEPGMLTAARPALPGQNPDYMRGFGDGELDALWERGVADWIVVEADGAAGRPLKAPSEKEPVIPSTACAVIAVVGLCGLGKHFTDTWVFRPGRFSEITGLAPGAEVTAQSLARAFCHPMGLFKNTPSGAARLAFFNQTDIPGGQDAARSLARAVFDTCRPDGVYAGSARNVNLEVRRFEMAARDRDHITNAPQA